MPAVATMERRMGLPTTSDSSVAASEKVCGEKAADRTGPTWPVSVPFHSADPVASCGSKSVTASRKKFRVS